MTVTPRLEQEVRYDLSWREQPDQTSLANYGGGKGLELIPTTRTELILGIPPYIVDGSSAQDGFGDMSFLLKYRVLSANEENGNHILTLFLGATVPTGSYRNGSRDAVVTPTIAFGKGRHHFDIDIQSTFGVSIPTADSFHFGHPMLSNTAFQYRLFRKFWPEVEVNATFWPDGSNSGRKSSLSHARPGSRPISNSQPSGLHVRWRCPDSGNQFPSVRLQLDSFATTAILSEPTSGP